MAVAELAAAREALPTSPLVKLTKDRVNNENVENFTSSSSASSGAVKHTGKPIGRKGKSSDTSLSKRKLSAPRVTVENPPKLARVTKSETTTSSRKDKSLARLCRRFLALCEGVPSPAVICMDQCSKVLGTWFLHSFFQCAVVELQK
jgi:hypothetical protein